MVTVVHGPTMDFDWRDSHFLLEAAREGNLENLQWLISEGHNVNAGDWDMVRPLHEACARGHFDCVSCLIDNGAEVIIDSTDHGLF